MDDKPLDLRDKIALEILNGVLSAAGGPSIEAHDLFKSLRVHFGYFDKDNPEDPNSTHKGVERVIRYAYSIADIMRKVRLAPFE